MRRLRLTDIRGQLLPVWTWEIHVPPLTLGFLLDEMRVILYRLQVTGKLQNIN